MLNFGLGSESAVCALHRYVYALKLALVDSLRDTKTAEELRLLPAFKVHRTKSLVALTR